MQTLLVVTLLYTCIHHFACIKTSQNAEKGTCLSISSHLDLEKTYFFKKQNLCVSLPTFLLKSLYPKSCILLVYLERLVD